ncbi:hypothetical protein SAMN05880593_13454 [Rhizobium sp. RU36D]|nr:hypothetical protein SAMN05880593_13454 [Rhizobium sp. RU36D]
MTPSQGFASLLLFAAVITGIAWFTALPTIGLLYILGVIQ